MVYQGSKARFAKELCPIINNLIMEYHIANYYELFVGGANIIDKIICENKYGFDANDNLITLLKYAQLHPELDIAPETCPLELYKSVRADKQHRVYPKEYYALIGYMASYGGRFFDGGYGRDSTGGRSIYNERLKNFKQQANNLSGINFQTVNYTDLDPTKFSNCLFYLDPPYRNTKKYSVNDINYDDFYAFCKSLANNNIVLISEQEMPEEFICVWEKQATRLQKSNRVSGQKCLEKLFVVAGGFGVENLIYGQK